MKFYLFLANLLFGITLLTFAVGASHFFGIILIKRLPGMPTAVKKQFRFLLLFGFISISMFLFFGKVIGVGAHSLRFADEARVSDELIPRLVQSVEVDETVALTKPVSEEQSTTLFSARTPASEADGAKRFNASVRMLSLVKDGFSSDECSRWSQSLVTRGIRVDRIASVQALFSGKNPAVICLSDGFSEDQLKQIEQWVFDGGPAFFVGRPSFSRSAAMDKILGINSFQSFDASKSATFVFGGPYLNFGAEGGAKITLSSDWATAPGMPLAQTGDSVSGAFLINANELTTLSPLVFSQFGKGRVLWTSLPPQVYGKLAILSGDLWNHWQKASLSFLLDLPVAGLSMRNQDAQPVKALAIHAEYKIDQLLKLLPALNEQKSKASAYFVLSEASESPEVLEEWTRAGNEVGFSFLNHDTPVSKNYYETRDGLSELLATSVRFAQKKPFPPGPYGLMLFPGVTASNDALGAALALNYRYVLGDPFSEQMAPYQLDAAPTRDLVKFYPDAAKINRFATHGGHLSVLPTPLGDDFAWPLQGTESEIRAKMESIDQLYAWAGAGTVYKVHTQNLKSGTMLGALTSVLKEKAHWLSVSELIHRSEISNQVSVSVEQKGPQSAAVLIKNESSEALLNPTVKISAGPRWSLESGNTIQQVDEKYFSGKAVTHWEVNLPRLNPGESKLIPLRYR